MTGALVAVGVAVVVVAAADLGLTVLHPSIRGPLSDRAEHLAWVTIRGLARRGAGDRLLSFGGPAAMAADLLAWVLGLWLGFALIYAPYVHVFGYAHAGQAAHAGFTEALYLSGESLTTAGFGDVTAGGQALRLVTIGEAASGLALIAAAIAYLTAVHPRVSLVRAAAAWVSDLEANTELGAARFACGRDEVARLHRDLIEIHQDLLRFPVLYYFHPRETGQSIASLLRAAGLVCASLRWGLDREAVPFAGFYGPALHRTIERLMGSYARELGVGAFAAGGQPLDQREAQARLLHLRDAVRRVAPRAVSGESGVPPELARFLARIDNFLREFGRVHHHSPSAAPLFAEPCTLRTGSHPVHVRPTSVALVRSRPPRDRDRNARRPARVRPSAVAARERDRSGSGCGETECHKDRDAVPADRGCGCAGDVVENGEVEDPAGGTGAGADHLDEEWPGDDSVGDRSCEARGRAVVQACRCRARRWLRVRR